MDRKVLTVQDISCFGQCSLTVALPIISACGIETAILPSAVLSTHTGGFTGYTFRDLTDDIPSIMAHWEKEHIAFDTIYTGYLGSAEQIRLVKELFHRVANPGCVKIVDPAMGDGGKLYTGFDMAFAAKMATLAAEADILLPNITEAAFMTGAPYMEKDYDETYVRMLMQKLLDAGTGAVVMTGISYREGEIGAAVLRRGETEISYYFHEKLPKNSHGTGDIFASAFTGAVTRGRDLLSAAKIAADFTLAGMKATISDDTHWYGTKFEKALPSLVEALR